MLDIIGPVLSAAMFMLMFIVSVICETAEAARPKARATLLTIEICIAVD